MTIPPPDFALSESRTYSIEPPPPLDGFSPEEFKTRRDGLRKAFPDSVILLRGASEEDAAYLAGAPYRQNSSFFYLTGVDTPGAFLALLPDKVLATLGVRTLKSDIKEILFLPVRNAGKETWTGGKLGPGEDTERATGLEAVVEASSLFGAAASWLSKNPNCGIIAPFGEGAKQTPEYLFMEDIRRCAPITQFQDISNELGSMRSQKSSSEIARIERAIEITCEGHRAAAEMIRNGAGKREYEIEAKIFEVFRSRGAHNAFGIIIGAGINGTVLHYEDNHSVLQKGALVVVDIGAKYRHYCGDLTRTYCVGGEPNARQQEIYGLVEEVFARVLIDYQPGIDSLFAMSERCKQLLKASPLRAKNAAGEVCTMDVFMPHGLSHHLGLDVHDVGDRDAPLLPGAVITIEPGLYIPSEGIGVRLEDDFLVTPTGLKRLGPELNHQL